MKRIILNKAFTLLELLMVLAMMGVLGVVAAWGSHQVIRDWQLQRATHQVYEGLKAAQSQAEIAGNLTVSANALVIQRTFVVFDLVRKSYTAFRWQDHSSDAVTQSDEIQQLWQRELPVGTEFLWAPDVDRRACSNVNRSPVDAITFSRPDYLPCNNQPCIKFDDNGFSVTGPGAIYLSNGEKSQAITATRPGHFTVCSWNGERWN